MLVGDAHKEDCQLALSSYSPLAGCLLGPHRDHRRVAIALCLNLFLFTCHLFTNIGPVLSGPKSAAFVLFVIFRTILPHNWERSRRTDGGLIGSGPVTNQRKKRIVTVPGSASLCGIFCVLFLSTSAIEDATKHNPTTVGFWNSKARSSNRTIDSNYYR